MQVEPIELDGIDALANELLDETIGPSCLVCYGELIILGTLGRTTHARCRQCGLDQSVDSALLSE